MDFLFQEALLYTSIPLRRNVSARISLRGLRMLIWIDTLRRDHTVGSLAGRLIYRNLFKNMLGLIFLENSSFRNVKVCVIKTYSSTGLTKRRSFTWRWKDSAALLKTYPDDLNKHIEASYCDNPNGALLFTYLDTQ